jgi:hypothetical protein
MLKSELPAVVKQSVGSRWQSLQSVAISLDLFFLLHTISDRHHFLYEDRSKAVGLQLQQKMSYAYVHIAWDK